MPTIWYRDKQTPRGTAFTLTTCPAQPLCWYVFLYIHPELEVVGIEVVAVDVGLADLVNVGVFVSEGDFVGAAVGMSSLFPKDWNIRVKLLKLMEPIPVAASQPFAALNPVVQQPAWVHLLFPLTVSFAYELAYLYMAGFSQPTPPFPIALRAAFTNDTIPEVKYVSISQQRV